MESLWFVVLMLVGVGLLQAFYPDSALWFQRWQFKDGDAVELSAEYRALLRVGGVVLILLGVGIVLIDGAIERQKRAEEHQNELRSAVEEVWGVWALLDDTDGYPSHSTLMTLDVPVTAGQAAPIDGWVKELRYGVIGSSTVDPEVIVDGESVVTFDGAGNGDLVAGVHIALQCEVTGVRVDQSDDATVVVTVHQAELPDAHQPSPLYRSVPGDPCTGSYFSSSWGVVHIPLDEPLGDRQVIDGRTGEPAVPVPID